MLVEKLPEGLHLRQDQAAFRRLDVLRHDEQHEVVRAVSDEVAGDGAQLVVLGEQPRDLAAQGFEAVMLFRADGEHRAARRFGYGFLSRAAFVVCCVGLRDDGEHGLFFFLKALHPRELFAVIARGGREQDERDVCLGGRPCRFFDTRRAELRLVIVKARRVDEDDGADASKLHRFVDGIRRRARFFRDDGEVLPDERIQEARLAAVAPPEEADVETARARRVLKGRHVITLPRLQIFSLPV